MRALLTLTSLLLVFSAAATDTTRTYRVLRAMHTPKIDGRLDDEAWKSAAVTAEFVQSLPIEGAAPSQRSEIRLLYDNTALYVAARMYDSDPDSILHELGNRDDHDLNADYFRIGIDPYNLRQDAYIFEVSAAGVQGDVRYSDNTFNAVWESAVQLDQTGWTAEIRIPYSAIRFPKKEVQEWALQFSRYIRRNREYDQWALVPAGNYSPMLHWGTLQGIEEVKSPVRLSLTPYASFYVERSPESVIGTRTTYANSTSYNFGADVKYGLDDRFTLDMTLLPDFGQVQSDNKIKNLSYQEVTYNENRGFFKEGTDLFSRNGLFYSRRIGKTPDLFYSVPSLIGAGETILENPSQVKLLNATKISGRTDGGLGLGLFNAITDRAEARIAGADGSAYTIQTEPMTNYSVLVAEQQLKNNSNVYLINTNVLREGTYADANVTGGGFTLADKKNAWAVDASGQVSMLFPGNDIRGPLQSATGYRYFYGGRKISGRFQFGMSRTVADSAYNQNDLGYFSINDFEHNRVYLQYFQFKPAKVFRESNHTLAVDYSVNHTTGERTSFQVSYDAFGSLLSYHSVYGGGGLSPLVNKDYNEPRVPGRYYNTIAYFYVYAGISSDYRKALAIDLTQNVSNFIERYTGYGYNSNLSLRYRFNDRFTLRYTNNYNFDPNSLGAVDWYSHPDTIYFGLRRLKTWENILSGKYLFKNDLSLTLNARHYWITGAYHTFLQLGRDGSLSEDAAFLAAHPVEYNFNYNVFNIDLVFSWQFAPGSFLSLVYKNAIETIDNETAVSFADDLRNTLKAPQTNGISVKAVYYLDYLYLVRKKDR